MVINPIIADNFASLFVFYCKTMVRFGFYVVTWLIFQYPEENRIWGDGTNWIPIDLNAKKKIHDFKIHPKKHWETINQIYQLFPLIWAVN